jgi:hypothetical protein
MAAIYSNGGNRWNILGFNFTISDALSSLYEISMLIYMIMEHNHAGRVSLELIPTYPVNISCGRKPECPEKTHDFR